MKFLPWVSPALFVVACCLPALTFQDNSGKLDVMLGLRALAVGWSGLFAGVMAWYANPFWLAGVGLLFWRKPTPAIVAGVLAVAIAYTTFAVVGRELPGDEGNVTKTTVIRLLPGCYVWMTSLVLMPVTALVQKLAR